MTDRPDHYSQLLTAHLDEWGEREASRIAGAVVFWKWSLADARAAVAARDGHDWSMLDRLAALYWRQIEDDAPGGG